MGVSDREPTADERTVTALSDEYEAALVGNDLASIDAVFWDSPDLLRYGVADMQTGFAAVVAWRAQAAPVSPTRQMLDRTVQELATGVVAVDITYRYADDTKLGRQSQTWVRRPEGWRIVRAHVSMIPA